MKKGMFSKFTSILQHAVDALAPQLSLQEEFVYHWKAVTAFFIDNKGEKIPVEQTNIPAHLEQMLVILQQEETNSERGMYGPCLEYLLQHKLLETLYSLGRTDYPPGMKQMVLSFFTKLLSRIKQPLLAHVNVYRAVQRLIKTCGEVKAGPAEIEEIQFLCTVCAKIKADPYLVNFFLEVPKPRQGSSSSSVNSPVLQEPTSENKLFQEFHLITTLLNLSHSEDRRVALKACEGLILCSSLPDPVAAHCMINSTKFCEDLTQRLVDTYSKLPEIINPLELEHVQAKWGMEVVTEREDQQTFVGKRLLVSFLSWLDYCDQLSTIANPIVAEALARTIHAKFLQPLFKPALLQMSEPGAITAMAYLTRCLHTVCSERLLSEFVLFVLGNERKTEVKHMSSDTLRSRLIERCNSVSEEVCLVSLQLLDTLLQKENEHILHNLVIRNLENRGYYESSGNKHKDIVKSDNLVPENIPNKSDIPEGIQSPDDSGLDICNCSENAESQSEAETQSEAESQNEVESQNEGDSSLVKETNVQETTSSTSDLEISSVNENDTNESECDKVDDGNHETEGRKDLDEEHDADSRTIESLDAVTDDKNNHNYVSIEDTVKEEQNEMKRMDDSDSEEIKTSNIEQTESVFKDLSTPGSSPYMTPSHTKTEVHKIVNSFLSLLPEDLKSSYQTADSGYDMYLRDAHRQCSAMTEACKTWGYPKQVPAESASSKVPFYEGSFLHMLLDKLSHILDQSYPVNLQLTSVISKLALVPHPCLHEFLLDPFCPLTPGTRNLYSIFQKVSKEIKSQLAEEPDLGQKLVKVRRKLMGANSSTQSPRESLYEHYNGWGKLMPNRSYGQTVQTLIRQLLQELSELGLHCLQKALKVVCMRLEDQSRLEAIIVLEEFCKELSAIAFVKHHAAVTDDRA